jgi:hypothetical protein
MFYINKIIFYVININHDNKKIVDENHILFLKCLQIIKNTILTNSYC